MKCMKFCNDASWNLYEVGHTWGLGYESVMRTAELFFIISVIFSVANFMNLLLFIKHEESPTLDFVMIFVIGYQFILSNVFYQQANHEYTLVPYLDAKLTWAFLCLQNILSIIRAILDFARNLYVSNKENENPIFCFNIIESYVNISNGINMLICGKALFGLVKEEFIKISIKISAKPVNNKIPKCKICSKNSVLFDNLYISKKIYFHERCLRSYIRNQPTHKIMELIKPAHIKGKSVMPLREFMGSASLEIWKSDIFNYVHSEITFIYNIFDNEFGIMDLNETKPKLVKKPTDDQIIKIAEINKLRINTNLQCDISSKVFCHNTLFDKLYIIPLTRNLSQIKSFPYVLYSSRNFCIVKDRWIMAGRCHGGESFSARIIDICDVEDGIRLVRIEKKQKCHIERTRPDQFLIDTQLNRGLFTDYLDFVQALTTSKPYEIII